MTLALLARNAALVLGLMTALWVVSVVRRDASIVDPWWSRAFLLVTGLTAGSTGLTPAKTLLLLMVAVGAIRLWLHLLLRSRGKPEDPRYAAFRQRYGPARYGWISFFQVCGALVGPLAVRRGRPYGWASIVAPPGMTILLVKVSGVAMLDAHLGATKPGYSDYVQRTSAFILRPPRQ